MANRQSAHLNHYARLRSAIVRRRNDVSGRLLGRATGSVAALGWNQLNAINHAN